jgi:hypothetical protein
MFFGHSKDSRWLQDERKLGQLNTGLHQQGYSKFPPILTPIIQGHFLLQEHRNVMLDLDI